MKGSRVQISVSARKVSNLQKCNCWLFLFLHSEKGLKSCFAVLSYPLLYPESAFSLAYATHKQMKIKVIKKLTSLKNSPASLMNHTLNLFEAHIKSDTVIFGDTSLEDKQKEFHFPLTGSNEQYPKQFIERPTNKL